MSLEAGIRRDAALTLKELFVFDVAMASLHEISQVYEDPKAARMAFLDGFEKSMRLHLEKRREASKKMTFEQLSWKLRVMRWFGFHIHFDDGMPLKIWTEEMNKFRDFLKEAMEQPASAVEMANNGFATSDEFKPKAIFLNRVEGAKHEDGRAENVSDGGHTG